MTKVLRARGKQTGPVKSTKQVEKEVNLALRVVLLSSYLNRRVGGKVYQMWRKAGKYGSSVDHRELMILCALKGCLDIVGRDMIGIDEFLGGYTGNGKHKRFVGFVLSKLIRFGYIDRAEYLKVPGSCAIGLSRRGWNVVKQYEDELRKLLVKFYPETDRAVLPMPDSPSLFRYHYHSPAE